MSAIIYVRVSTVEQAEQGLSLDAQVAQCRKYAEMRNLEVSSVISEPGISGAVPLEKRPNRNKLKQTIAKKQAQAIIVVKLDRLFRDAEDALRNINEFERRRIALHIIDLGGSSIDTSTAWGKFMLTVLSGAAEMERNLISERTAAVMRAKKSRLEAYTRTPYGFDRIENQFVENCYEQKVIVRIANFRADGGTLQAICDCLNSEGVKTKRGYSWKPATVHYILNNSIQANKNLK